MKHCTQCGHVLGLGRFCTNCGHPVASRHADPLSDPLSDLLSDPTERDDDPPLSRPTPPVTDEPDGAEDWRGDTAERPRPPAVTHEVRVAAGPAVPRVPPAVVEAPPPPRFPLFADEVDGGEAEGPAQAPATPASGLLLEPAPWAPASWDDDPADAYDEEDEHDENWEDERRPRAVWAGGAVALIAALVLAAWLLGEALGGDDDTADDTAGSAADPSRAPVPVDHTADAGAQAPRTAPSTEDLDGNPTSYAAGNMLDGVPETAWRAAGDGSGLKLVFTFPERTRISEVGLVNGYAKTATDAEGRTFDWYAGHRRITQVTWNFGTGTVVRQDLEDDRALQTTEVEPVEVRKVVLKIVATTAPGEGPARRDFTAISDVSLVG